MNNFDYALLGRVISWMSKVLENALSDCGLSLSQYRVLLILSSEGAASTFLAKRLLVKPSSVTAVIDGLVQKGLVNRTSDYTDRRLVNLEISNRGLLVLADAQKAIEERFKPLILELDPVWQKNLNELFSILLNSLTSQLERKISQDERTRPAR